VAPHPPGLLVVGLQGTRVKEARVCPP
jgi:hypothetical protein